MRRYYSSLFGAAALAAALGACESVADPETPDELDGLVREPSLLAGAVDSPNRIELADTVAVNTPVPIVVPTGGGGCIRQGDTESTVSGLTADVRPYDYFPPRSADVVCTADFRVLRHTATLQFSQRGTATVRVHGRLSPDRPTVVTRSVVVR